MARNAGTLELAPLPYPEHALAPYIGAETVRLHHGKHQAGYVEKLRKLVSGRAQEGASLIELVCSARGRVYENAAQVWNHEFYWRSMTPGGGGDPDGPIAGEIRRAFGDMDHFRERFVTLGNEHFGSGYLWLVWDGRMSLLTTSNADNPMRRGLRPLLTADLWEHAYYLDHQNDRKRYLEHFVESLANWSFVFDNWTTAVTPRASSPPESAADSAAWTRR
jgi:Fe-Mn family superoxide dismutase